MKQKKLVFVGYTRYGLEPICGQTIKNQMLISRLKELNLKVKVIDAYHFKKHFWRGLKFIISESNDLAYWLIKFFYYFSFKRDVFYFVIGGTLHKKVKEGSFNSKYMHYLKLIAVESNTMEKELKNSGLKKALFVPNSKKISYIPIKNYNEKNVSKFVFLSRIRPEKGVDYIFDSVYKLNFQGYSSKFIVDFYGPVHDEYKEEFNKKIQQFDNVNFNGFLNLREEEGYDKLAKYDVMLFPTFWSGEGFAGIFIDAYIAGLPLIATDWNLNKELIIDKETGLIIHPHNVEELILAMKFFIDNNNVAKSMSENCQKEALNFDTKNVWSDIFFKNIGII